MVYHRLKNLVLPSVERAGRLSQYSVNETAFPIFKHSESFLNTMLQFINVFTFCFADSVSACSISTFLFWKIIFVVFSPDPCLNVYIFSHVYVRHQFMVLTAFCCSVIQTLKELRLKRNCQAIAHLTKAKESQRSLRVSGMNL